MSVTVPILVPAWTLVAFLGVGALACVMWSLQFRFCTYHQSRWIVAGLLGAGVSATLAPSAWIGAFLVGMALAIPVSILLLQRGWTIALADPVAGTGQLVMVSAWVVVLGVMANALQVTGIWPLLGIMLALAAYNNAVGAIQVYRGIKAWVYQDDAFGPKGTVVRQPTAFLHNVWKVSAINAMCAPVGLALLLADNQWGKALGLAWCLLALWQLVKAGGFTCNVAALAGAFAVAVLTGFSLGALVAAPLALVAYPIARRELLGDPRWEAWRIAARLLRRNRGLGIGLGGWLGLRVQTPKEGERIWMWLHNDWMETWLECGPLPVLCACGYLGTAVARVAGPVSPLEAGLFGSLVSLAVLSLGYMPWRTWPVNLWALGIVACWEASWR